MTTVLTIEQCNRLCQQAQEVAKNAYAPYSKFRVGAAVLGSKGIYLGTNVENASYGLTTCAERVALGAAVADGDREFQAIAVACIDGDPNKGLEEFVPCGACRQWMIELAPNAQVLICQKDATFQVAELLPNAFRLLDEST